MCNLANTYLDLTEYPFFPFTLSESQTKHITDHTIYVLHAYLSLAAHDYNTLKHSKLVNQRNNPTLTVPCIFDFN